MISIFRVCDKKNNNASLTLVNKQCNMDFRKILGVFLVHYIASASFYNGKRYITFK